MAEAEVRGLNQRASTTPIDFTKPLDKTKLKEKSVLVTGGANGIGLASATAFAEAGAYVTLADISTEAGEEAAKTLSDKGYHVQFITTDATSWESQTAAFKAAIAFAPSKSIDLVVASAGVTGQDMRRWLDAQPSKDADPAPPGTAALDINLTGVYYTAHLALHYFRHTAPAEESTHSDKHLIFVSSLAGYVGLNTAGEYNASKFGVRGLWKGMRHFNPFTTNPPTSLTSSSPPPARFRANLIAPTFIHTNMTSEIKEGLSKAGIAMGTVGDVVAGVMRCACDEGVSGRAVAIAAGRGEEGDQNFDLGDEIEEGDGGRVLLERVKAGVLGNIHLLAGDDSARRRKA